VCFLSAPGAPLITTQLKAISSKKVRAFYEEQNRRIDDWAEVDMVVSSLADDVLDSMNPRDTDGDGVAEDRGPLGTSGEDLEPFLPDEERDRRRKAAKHVRWAINVSDGKTRETQYGLLRMNRST
jgi:hypothetical protein